MVFLGHGCPGAEHCLYPAGYAGHFLHGLCLVWPLEVPEVCLQLIPAGYRLDLRFRVNSLGVTATGAISPPDSPGLQSPWEPGRGALYRGVEDERGTESTANKDSRQGALVALLGTHRVNIQLYVWLPISVAVCTL